MEYDPAAARMSSVVYMAHSNDKWRQRGFFIKHEFFAPHIRACTWLIAVLIPELFSPARRAQVDTHWAAHYNAGGTSSERLNSMAVDVRGNVYATGPSWRAIHDWIYGTAKWRAAGNLRGATIHGVWHELRSHLDNSR